MTREYDRLWDELIELKADNERLRDARQLDAENTTLAFKLGNLEQTDKDNRERTKQLEADNDRLRIAARDVRHRNDCLQSDFSVLERYRDQLEAVRDAAKKTVSQAISECEQLQTEIPDDIVELEAALTAAENDNG